VVDHRAARPRCRHAVWWRDRRVPATVVGTTTTTTTAVAHSTLPRANPPQSQP